MKVMNAFRILLRISTRKDITIAVKETGCEDVYWIHWLRVRSDIGIL
jgi:hypothetical protein